MKNTAKEMTLLVDTKLYAIQCDYYMCRKIGEDENGEDVYEDYTERVYWAIDTSTKANIIIMVETVNSPNLRVFNSLNAVKNYIKTHTTGNGICMENVKPCEIKYNFEKKEWEVV